MADKTMKAYQKVDPKKCAALYRDGFSLREIAVHLDISVQTAANHLKRLGVELRPKHVNRHAANYTGRRAGPDD